jgi:hypothetical protein
MSQTRSLRRSNTHKDMFMHTNNGFQNFLDDLIHEKAQKVSDGFYLHLFQLTPIERRKLVKLQTAYGCLQDLINDRCDELHRNYLENRGFDD